jgi:hypothetical protein
MRVYCRLNVYVRILGEGDEISRKLSGLLVRCLRRRIIGSFLSRPFLCQFFRKSLEIHDRTLRAVSEAKKSDLIRHDQGA